MDARLQGQVWRRARDRCEYCRFPARITHLPFQIDPVIAEKHGGRTELGNLALSCFFRNTFKGPNLAGLDPETQRVTRLFHPRRDRWSDHFCWNGPRLEGRSPIGRATIEVLRTNRDDVVAVRQSLLEEDAL